MPLKMDESFFSLPLQGLRIIFSESSRLIFRLSGTGVGVGATIRIYAESFERDPERHNREPQVQDTTLTLGLPVLVFILLLVLLLHLNIVHFQCLGLCFNLILPISSLLGNLSIWKKSVQFIYVHFYIVYAVTVSSIFSDTVT